MGLQNANAVLTFERNFAQRSHFTALRIAQGLQNASAVLNLDEDRAPLSHFTDPGAPECERCAQVGKEFGTALALYGLQALQGTPARAPAKGPPCTPGPKSFQN